MVISEERICRIWHSLLPNAKRLGYKQLFLDKFDCESKQSFLDIVDIDNVNKPNMTKYTVNWMQKPERWRLKHVRKESDFDRNNSWFVEWRKIER